MTAIFMVMLVRDASRMAVYAPVPVQERKAHSDHLIFFAKKRKLLAVSR
jgi:hypothetical protein